MSHPNRTRPFAKLAIRGLLGAAACGLVIVGQAERAAAVTVTIAYDVALSGVSLGQGTLVFTLEERSYRIDGEGRTAGLLGVFADNRGETSAAGALGNGRPLPARFVSRSSGGDRSTLIELTFASDAVTSAVVEPPPRRPERRIPLEEAHKRGVVDPLSAIIIPQADGDPLSEATCARTIPVFDGTTRFDVALSFRRVETVDRGGYRGPALVCGATYRPIAGHRTDREVVRRLAEARDIEIWFAPVRGTRWLVPVRTRLPTPFGEGSAAARRFEIGDGPARPDRN